MPDIHFECAKCGQPIDAPEELASQLIECPTCKETIEVPARSQREQAPNASLILPRAHGQQTTARPSAFVPLPPTPLPAIHAAAAFPITYVMFLLVGAMLGYAGSYFGQSGLFRTYISLGDYIGNAQKVLILPSNSPSDFMTNSVCITGWEGVVLGVVVMCGIIVYIETNKRHKKL